MSAPRRVAGWEALEGDEHDALRSTGSVVTIGMFDGLHRGHQRLLSAAARLASASGLARVHVRFDPHPDLVLRGSLPARLLDEAELLLRLGEAGVTSLLDLPFDAAMRETPWEIFVARLVAATGAKGFVLSPESAIGKGREGTLARLRSWGASRGLQVHPVAEARAGGLAISSTRIRAAVAAGELAAAARMLGRPHAVTGTLRGGRLQIDGGGAEFALPPSGRYRLRLGHAARPAGRLPLTGRLTTGGLDTPAGEIELPPTALQGAPAGVGREGEPLREGERLRAALLAGRNDA